MFKYIYLHVTVIVVCLFLFPSQSTGQVGIETSNVDPSAILEINTGDLPVGNKKGFLGPRVELKGNRDVETIPNPATGLLVYNTTTYGIFPDNVLANRFYFWNGTQWVDLNFNAALQNYLVNRMISVNSTATQTFGYNAINNSSGLNNGSTVSFADSDIVVNRGAVAEKSGNVFIIKVDGLYEISAYVNYNPNRTTTNSRGCFLNLKLQRSTDDGTTWTDVIGNRTAWGVRSTNYLKTATLISTPIYLREDDMLRLVIQNPFGIGDTSSLHGESNETSGNTARITTSSKIPISKSLTISLLDYDLKE